MRTPKELTAGLHLIIYPALMLKGLGTYLLLLSVYAGPVWVPTVVVLIATLCVTGLETLMPDKRQWQPSNSDDSARMGPCLLGNTATRSTVVISLPFGLGGCSVPVKPVMSDLSLEKTELLRGNNIVITKRVTLERAKKMLFISGFEKTVDVTATSKFGEEHAIANVDCIVSGLQDVLGETSVFESAEDAAKQWQPGQCAIPLGIEPEQ